MDSKKSIEIIIPVYNEVESLPKMLGRLEETSGKRPDLVWSFIFVNDGSRDGSEELLDDLSISNKNIKVVHFSRNFGHQAAVTAGLEMADADYIGIIDADLQDPPEVFIDMLEALECGNNLAYGTRSKRKGETIFKVLSASLFYKVLNHLSGIEIPADTGDFRLFDKKVHHALLSLPEYHRFIRGMVAWVGFKTAKIEYIRDARYAGVSKYPFFKMLKFSADAILSFSSTPLKLANYAGLITTFLGGLGMCFIAFQYLFKNQYIPGVSAVLFASLMIGGVQLITIGILGEYIGRIFEENKNRPHFILKESKNFDNQKDNVYGLKTSGDRKRRRVS